MDSLDVNKHTVRKTWYRTTFLQFLAEQGGLIVSVLRIAKLFMSGYSEFVMQTDLVEKLYFHAGDDDDGNSGPSSQ